MSSTRALCYSGTFEFYVSTFFSLIICVSLFLFKIRSETHVDAQTANEEKSRAFNFVQADMGIKSFKLYHKTHLLLLGVTPIAVVASPSMLNVPLDFVLALGIPLHAHIGMNWVISDYVPPATRGLARGALAGLTLVTVAGLLKLNYDGPGITESIKGLWREEKKE